MVGKDFFPYSEVHLLTQTMVSFTVRKHFSFIWSLLLVCLRLALLGFLFRTSLFVPVNSNVFPILSSIRFRVSYFMLKFIIHLELNFVQGRRWGCLQLSSWTSTVCSRCCFFLRYFWLVKSQMSMEVWVYMSVLNYISLINKLVFIQV